AVIGAVVFAVCLAVGVLWLASGRRDVHGQPEQARPGPPPFPAGGQAEKESAREENRDHPVSRPNFVKQDNPAVGAPPERPSPAPARPVVGHVAALKGQANLLLERRPDGKTWQALAADRPVSAPALLLALPGVRGTVRLDSGLEMTLWGNVREAFIP